MGSGGKILVCPCVAVDGCGSNYDWSWMVVGNLLISLIFMEKVKSFTAFLTLNVSRERQNIFSSKKSRYSGLDW